MERMKIAIAINKDTFEELKTKSFSDFIEMREHINMVRFITTPDETYAILLWDWEKPDEKPFTEMIRFLEYRRHALIEISDDGAIFTDIETEDEFGCDEEFNEILGWKAEICLWQDDTTTII